MFSTWKQEKATAALVDEAQDLADKLASAKQHVIDSYAAAAWFWAASHLTTGQNLHQITTWKPAAVTRFAGATATKIAAMRKQREYASSDGLTIWLHTARAVTEPRVTPAAQHLWRVLAKAGPNTPTMADDLLAEAGLPPGFNRNAPDGFHPED